jgi:uncharacterized membrane protein YcaP (DUF421 family)
MAEFHPLFPNRKNRNLSMELNELGWTAARAVAIYVFVLIVVRLQGKRTIGNFTAFDLIVAFIISEVVDEPIYGDVPMLQGLVAIGVVAALHYANSALGFHFPSFDELTGGKPRVLIEDGKMIKSAMAAEHINESELKSLLRENEIDDLKDVAVGTLETNGQLSVKRTEEARELEKRDLA